MHARKPHHVDHTNYPSCKHYMPTQSTHVCVVSTVWLRYSFTVTYWVLFGVRPVGVLWCVCLHSVYCPRIAANAPKFPLRAFYLIWVNNHVINTHTHTHLCMADLIVVERQKKGGGSFHSNVQLLKIGPTITKNWDYDLQPFESVPLPQAQPTQYKKHHVASLLSFCHITSRWLYWPEKGDIVTAPDMLNASLVKSKLASC